MEHLLRRVVSITILVQFTAMLWGQGQPKTPYPGKPSLSEVIRIRKKTDETRKLRNFQPTPSSPATTIFEAGIGYCSSDGVTDPGFVLTPFDANPIRLGDLQSFSLLHVDEQALTLRVAILPEITEDLLLREQPSYTLLKGTYSKTIEIKIPRFKKGSRSCIVGKQRDYDEVRQMITFLDALSPNRVTSLYYDSNIVWWAIPSVIADANYPLRVGPSAYGDIIDLK